MKEEMKHQLIKDITVAAIAWVVVSILMGVIGDAGLFGGIFIGFFCAGVPFGWRWLSNLYTALSLQAVAIKAILAILLGWIALPVVIIKDVVNYVNAG